MEPSATRVLLPLASRRSRSFAEATETILSAVAGELPGALALAQLEPEGKSMRVVHTCGDEIPGIKRGASLATAAAAADDPLDGAFLRGLGVKAEVAIPLETSDGNMVGALCALSMKPDAYRADDAVLLGVAARLLSLEWENVRARAELRTLRRQRSQGDRVDPQTGLRDRTGFGEPLEREWRLAQRGTVRSVVVACHVDVTDRDETMADDPARQADAHQRLAIKDAAEVLAGTVRETDLVGRVADDKLAVVLVGCENDEGARAAIDRYEAALSRATRSRPYAVTASFGVRALHSAESAEAALTEAEAEALETGVPA